jgi:arylsulfatase
MWYNTTAMHFRTHCAEKNKGKSGQGFYNDVMVAHDEHIGQMLNKLDELGIANDTIVMYSTDNGPHYNSWPDGGITPFRSEKNTNWEGGWRVPAFVRWPGKFKAGTVLNGIVSHQDWLPTLLAAAGEPDIKSKLLNGHKVGNKTFKVYIDGYNILHSAARAQDVQSPKRSVRARRRELEYLLGLRDLACLPDIRHAGSRGRTDRGLQKVSAAAEACVVQPGCGDEETAGCGRRR